MPTETVDNLCQRAKQATAQGRMEEARQLYLQALGQKSHSPDIHYGLATVCFLLNDLAGAAHHFSEVIRLDPMRPGAYINLGAVQNRMGDHAQAIQTLRRGLQIDPDRAEGHYNLGLVYRAGNQLEQAVESYRAATKLKPKMVDAHYNLANAYLDLRKYEQSAECYRTVLELKPHWEKAEKGLAAAEQGITARADLAAGKPVSPAQGTPAKVLDPERLVNPETHGELLKDLYRATADSEDKGRHFLETLEKQVEPALKNLYTALLRPKSGLPLDDCVEKFEKVMEDIRTAQVSLKRSVERVQSLGEKLVES